MRRAILLIALGLSLACGLWWWLREPHPKPVNAALYETAMIEELIRHVVSELTPNASEVCFVGFGDGPTPPSQPFIARLANSQPVVRSSMTAVSPAGGNYFEKATGKPGWMLQIIRFKEVVPGEYDVRVALTDPVGDHNRLKYRLVQVESGWKVTRRNKE